MKTPLSTPSAADRDTAHSEPGNQIIPLNGIFKGITLETRLGRPVCKIDDALKLITEFNRLFGEKVSIDTELIKRDDEGQDLDNAYAVTLKAVLETYGVPDGTLLHTLPEDVKWKYIRLQIGWESGRPNPLCIFENPEISSCDEVIKLVDDEKDPFGKLFIQTALEDLRVDIGGLLRTMGHTMDLRGIHPFLHKESEAVRRNFKRLIDTLLQEIGLEKCGPAFAVIGMEKLRSSKDATIAPVGPIIDINEEVHKGTLQAMK